MKRIVTLSTLHRTRGPLRSVGASRRTSAPKLFYLGCQSEMGRMMIAAGAGGEQASLAQSGFDVRVFVGSGCELVWLVPGAAVDLAMSSRQAIRVGASSGLPTLAGWPVSPSRFLDVHPWMRSPSQVHRHRRSLRKWSGAFVRS